MVDKFAIFCDSQRAAEMLLKRVRNTIKCENLNSRPAEDNKNHVIIFTITEITTSRQDISRTIAKNLNLYANDSVIEYGFLRFNVDKLTLDIFESKNKRSRY